MAAPMSRVTGQKSNQVLALDTPLAYDQDNEMIWGDEGSNKELIYLHADGSSVRRQSLTNYNVIRYATSIGDSRVRIAKFAPETHLLCLQRNDREVEFLDLKPFIVAPPTDNSADADASSSQSGTSPSKNEGGDGKVDNKEKSQTSAVSDEESRKRALRFSLPCSTSAKVENKLLGFFWVSSTLLVLVSRTMIELFQFNPRVLQTEASSRKAASSSSASNAPMAKIREIAISVVWWSYAASSRILIVSTDPSSNKFAPFVFTAPFVDANALPIFKVEMKMVERIAKGDLYVRQIYGLMFCIFINNALNELVLYQLRPDGAALHLTITNLPAGPLRLSFVDNMILAHSLSLNISAVYDIRYRPKSSRSIEHPITPPLPITRPLDVGLPSNSISQSPEHNSFDDIPPSPRSAGPFSPLKEALNASTNSKLSPPASPSPLSGSSASDTPTTSASINITPKKSSSNAPNMDGIDASNDLLSTSVVGLKIAPNGSSSASSSSSSSKNTSSQSTSLPSTPGGKDENSNSERHFSYSVVQFLIPEYAVNRYTGQIYRLSLYLEGFVAAFRDQFRLCQFLVHRDASKLILLSLVRRMISYRADMRVIADVLDLFTGSLQVYHEEQRLLQMAASRASSGAGGVPPGHNINSGSPHASSSARAISSSSSKRSSTDAAGVVRSGSFPSLSSSSGSVPSGTRDSWGGVVVSEAQLSTSASASTSPKNKKGTSSTSDPWFSRRADQYVAAFKKSKGGASNNVSSSSSGVAGSPASSGMNNTAGLSTTPSASASNNGANGGNGSNNANNATNANGGNGSASNGGGGNGSPSSSPSSGTMSPEIMSPNSSMGALPTPEEIGLDLGVNGSGLGSLASVVAPSLVDPTQIRTRSRNVLVVTQQDMYTQVFLPLEEKGIPWKTLICVLTTYVTSLTQRAQLAVDTDIYGFMIDLLVRNKQYYQLHQLLQLRIITDSLHVACQLMYLSSTYPPATQLGLDMFKRLKEHAYTIESLLSRGMVLMGLKFLKTVRWTAHEAQSLVPRFLQEAKYSGDLTLFYVTYSFFLQRNEIFTGICDEYARFFQSEFESPPSVLPTV